MSDYSPTKVAFLLALNAEPLTPLEVQGPLLTSIIPALVKLANSQVNIKCTLILGLPDSSPVYRDKALFSKLESLVDTICSSSALSIIVGVGSYKPEDPVSFWNNLAQAALDNDCEYLYAFSHSDKFLDDNWLANYIKALRGNPFCENLGLVLAHAGLDDQHTNFFLSRLHFAIYGSLFPPPLSLSMARRWLYETYKQFNWLSILPSLYAVTDEAPLQISHPNEPWTVRVFENLMSGTQRHTHLWMECMAKTPTGKVQIPESQVLNRVHLITQYYHPKDAARRSEIDECLRKNYQNPLIDKIHLLTEEFYDLNSTLGREASGRVQQVVIGKRLTYAAAFQYANANLAGAVCILANADIYFDQTLAVIQRLALNKHVLTLTRHEVRENGPPILYNFIGPCGNPAVGTQDAWIFKAPLPELEADIELGHQGCDNRIASDLYHSWLEVLNPCRTISALHLHTTAFREYDRRKVLSGPHLFVNHCEITAAPKEEVASLDFPASLATIATIDAYYDLRILLYSVSLYMPGIEVVILTDAQLKAKIQTEFPQLRLNIQTGLEKYCGKTRQQMEREGIWCDFMLEKCQCIDLALKQHADTLYVDADVVFLGELPQVNKQCDLYLSPHDIRADDQAKYGKYNGGFLWISNPEFSTWWKTETRRNPHFFEQSTLDSAQSTFKVNTFISNHNFGWWRLFQCERPLLRANQFSLNATGIICYQNKALQSIHTHFGHNEGTIGHFNAFIENLMQQSKHAKLQSLRSFIGSKIIAPSSRG